MTPFTLVLCRAEGCSGPSEGRSGPVEQVLGETTRGCPHGVLVVAGCLLGTLCRACGPRAGRSGAAPDEAGGAREAAGLERAGRDRGRVALVQPCDRDRVPSGPAVLVGPIRDPADTAALSRWLRAGPLTADGLPERLRGYERVLRRGPLN